MAKTAPTPRTAQVEAGHGEHPTTAKPLLLLDVDGPLNPFEAPHRPPASYEQHYLLPDTWIAQHSHMPADRVRPLPVVLNPEHGSRLLALPFDLVWATTWEHDANLWISPRIGLPTDLPVIEFGDQHVVRPDMTYVKTWTIVEYAQGRPFAWVDDQIAQTDRAYVAEHHPGPALLHYVDPARGLTDDDFTTLAKWAAGLPGVSRAGGST